MLEHHFQNCRLGFIFTYYCIFHFQSLRIFEAFEVLEKEKGDVKCWPCQSVPAPCCLMVGAALKITMKVKHILQDHSPYELIRYLNEYGYRIWLAAYSAGFQTLLKVAQDFRPSVFFHQSTPPRALRIMTLYSPRKSIIFEFQRGQWPRWNRF
jgi:hypothetical protein